MDKNQYILSQIKKRLYIIDPEVRIFLFGSRARNDFREDSDWDILILTKKQITQAFKNEISDSFFEIELETDHGLTSIIQDENTWEKYTNTPIYQNIKKDGIEL